eukprot:g29329.t1
MLPDMFSFSSILCLLLLQDIYTTANALETKFPEVLFIVASDFNQANLKRSVFLSVNPWKAMGPNGVPGWVLRLCVDQLAEVFTDIFNLSLLQAEVPTCFKKTTIIPVPKKTPATCLNDYCPLVLTSIIMKCFERLVMAHINSSLPA